MTFWSVISILLLDAMTYKKGIYILWFMEKVHDTSIYRTWNNGCNRTLSGPKSNSPIVNVWTRIHGYNIINNNLHKWFVVYEKCSIVVNFQYTTYQIAWYVRHLVCYILKHHYVQNKQIMRLYIYICLCSLTFVWGKRNCLPRWWGHKTKQMLWPPNQNRCCFIICINYENNILPNRCMQITQLESAIRGIPTFLIP